ncbi:uncharacterized protein FFM5_12562 [Fusarium fujikuroi]
MSCM